MKTSAYIVVIYLTGNQVLICKYCYYYYQQEKLLISQFFLCRNKGYILHRNMWIFYISFIYLFGAVKFHKMYLV